MVTAVLIIIDCCWRLLLLLLYSHRMSFDTRYQVYLFVKYQVIVLTLAEGMSWRSVSWGHLPKMRKCGKDSTRDQRRSTDGSITWGAPVAPIAISATSTYSGTALVTLSYLWCKNALAVRHGGKRRILDFPDEESATAGWHGWTLSNCCIYSSNWLKYQGATAVTGCSLELYDLMMW